jgi:glycosyltransferase involved in cell wall biosynthesis
VKPLYLNVVVPCFNEEDVLPETAQRLLRLFDRLRAADRIDDRSTITFVDDGSRDGTWRVIEQLNRLDVRISGLKLSRNCGHQNALLAGLLTAPGEVLVSLDADLQDDLEAIPQMLDAFEGGADIVFGVRSRRDADSWFKRYSAWAYYWLLRRCGVDIIPDHADFRLMSRRALEALGSFREVNLFLRGIIPLLGFRTQSVIYDRHSRFAGRSKYPVRKMLALAMNGIFAFSTVPLQWIAVFGLIVAVGSIGAGFWALFVRLVAQTALPGWASTVIPMYFLGGVQLLALGIIGSYVSRVYAETKQRPRFIIEKAL